MGILARALGRLERTNVHGAMSKLDHDSTQERRTRRWPSVTQTAVAVGVVAAAALASGGGHGFPTTHHRHLQCYFWSGM